MPPADASQRQLDDAQGPPPLQCDACESALHTPSKQAVSFLLLEQLTVPLVGCDEHLERFASVCGFTTDEAVELLEHRPAGGVSCPSCQFAVTSPEHPVIPVREGAVAPLACSEHLAEVITRFDTGLDTERQLTGSLDALE
jgi:hypothetical protein